MDWKVGIVANLDADETPLSLGASATSLSTTSRIANRAASSTSRPSPTTLKEDGSQRFCRILNQKHLAKIR
jgi:hypothetical protein